MSASHMSAEYFMKLLGFETPEELVEFLNQPDMPTGGMKPPDDYYEAIQELEDEEERLAATPAPANTRKLEDPPTPKPLPAGSSSGAFVRKPQKFRFTFCLATSRQGAPSITVTMPPHFADASPSGRQAMGVYTEISIHTASFR